MVLNAAQALQHAQYFPRLMELILVVGNFMNNGFRGGVSAFRIHSINKLSDTKSADGRTTLLAFLAETVETRFPELKGFLDELKDVGDACRVSFADLRSEFVEVGEKLEELSAELDSHFPEEIEEEEAAEEAEADAKAEEGSGGRPSREKMLRKGDQAFGAAMRRFLLIQRPRYAQLTQQYEEMKRSYAEAVTLYGEDGNRMQPDEFFGIFRAFSISFTGSLKEMRERKEREARAAQRREREEADRLERIKRAEEAKKAREEAGGVGGGSEDGGTGSGTDKGMMDKLLEGLRSGREPHKRIRNRLAPVEGSKEDAAIQRERRLKARQSSVSKKTIDLLASLREDDGIDRQPNPPPLPSTKEDYEE